jgi:hypothetical protein
MSYGRKVAHNRRGAPKPWFNPGRVNGHCSSSPRQHPSHNLRDQPRVMLPRRALQRVRPLEAVRPRDRHLPAVARFGADDRHHPFSQPVRGTCSTSAATSRCGASSPVWCISTVTGISPKISARVIPSKPRHRKDYPAERLAAEYAWAYGDGPFQAQTRQPRLGASHSARSGHSHRVRTAGQAPAPHAPDVHVVARAPHLVPPKQKPCLRPRMAPQRMGHHGRRPLHRRRLTAQTFATWASPQRASVVL